MAVEAVQGKVGRMVADEVVVEAAGNSMRPGRAEVRELAAPAADNLILLVLAAVPAKVKAIPQAQQVALVRDNGIPREWPVDGAVVNSGILPVPQAVQAVDNNGILPAQRVVQAPVPDLIPQVFAVVLAKVKEILPGRQVAPVRDNGIPQGWPVDQAVVNNGILPVPRADQAVDNSGILPAQRVVQEQVLVLILPVLVAVPAKVKEIPQAPLAVQERDNGIPRE